MSGDDIIETFVWDTRSKKHFPSLYEKASFIKEKFFDIRARYSVESIFVEQSLQSFRSGFSSAKTLSTLARFNGTISWFCWEVFGIKPLMIAASSARKLAGLKIKRGQKAKEKVLEFVLDKYPQIVVEYTKHGNPKPGVYDMCDSIIIAIAGTQFARETTNTN